MNITDLWKEAEAMKVKIDSYGYLHIERAGRMEGALCPLHLGGVQCGHWCVMFGEPVLYYGGTTGIDLCRKSLLVPTADFTDERHK